MERGSDNSRSKDIFDLHLFLPKADPKKLKAALEACFKYRETELPKDLVEKLKKIDLAILTRGWRSATSVIKDAPPCEVAFQTIIREISKFMKNS